MEVMAPRENATTSQEAAHRQGGATERRGWLGMQAGRRQHTLLCASFTVAWHPTHPPTSAQRIPASTHPPA